MRDSLKVIRLYLFIASSSDRQFSASGYNRGATFIPSGHRLTPLLFGADCRNANLFPAYRSRDSGSTCQAYSLHLQLVVAGREFCPFRVSALQHPLSVSWHRA